jgi:Fe-S cluster biogenesis protein NfuA
MKATPENIRRVLKEKVAPALAAHGGDIQLIEAGEDGIVRVRLMGACAHCMGAVETMELVVTTMLKQEFPEIKEVIADDSVDEELLEEALKLLRKPR